MKTNYLLPQVWKKIGWIAMIPLVLLLILDVAGFGNVIPWWLNVNLYTVLPVGFSIVLLLICFSKEKVEDEFIMKIRGDSLIWAVILNYLIVIVGSLAFYELDYFSFMAYNMFTVLVLYLLKFNIALYNLRKSARYEK